MHHNVAPDKNGWNAFIAKAKTGHALQMWEFGAMRRELGTVVERVTVEDGTSIKAAAQITIHPIPKTTYTVGYVARGPALDESWETILPPLIVGFKEIAEKHNCLFIKIEPYVSDTTNLSTILLAHSLQPSASTTFMPATSLIDLTQSEEQLLAHCRKNTRYYIRKAPKEGITIREGTSTEDLALFHMLLKQTAERQGFRIGARPLAYFTTLWKHFKEGHDTNMRLYFAEKNEVPFAGTIHLYAGNHAYYPYGASSHLAHGTAATEGLMWHSIIEAKKAGCVDLNLWGVLAEKDLSHPYWGYTFFKKGFGGETIRFVGSFDLVFHKHLYHLFNTIDLARKKLRL